MNKSRKMPAWLQVSLALIVFMAVLGLAFTYQEQLKEAVLIPLLYLLWVGELAFRSFDQHCIWLLTLIMALFLSLSASRREKDPFKETRSTAQLRPPATGRIHFWKTQVWVGSSRVYVRSYRRSELRRLIIKALAYREHRDPEEIKAQLRTGQLRLPAEASYFLGLAEQQAEPDQPLRLSERIKRRLNRITERCGTSTFMPDPRLEKIAEYLESLLEVDYDPGNH